MREYLPSVAVRRVRSMRNRCAKWREARALRHRLARHGVFSPDELHDKLLANGVRQETVLLVHSAFGPFTNFQGSAIDVLAVLDRIAGDQGTIVMPAQPKAGAVVFDIDRSAVSTGLICELFRRQEDAIRSLHPGQSVCAKGPKAHELTFEHHLDPLGCGRLSPFAKLVDLDSQILGLGLPPLWTTFLHVAEDLDLGAFPISIYDGQRTFKVIDQQKTEQELTIPLRDDRVLTRMNLKGMQARVSNSALNVFSIGGIPMFTAEPQALLEELTTLSQSGITIYS